MTRCSGVGGCVCRGVRRRPWLQGWAGRGLLWPPHLAGHLTLSCHWNFHGLGAQHLPIPTPNHETKCFSLEAICENNGLYLKNKLSYNTREGHCDCTPVPQTRLRWQGYSPAVAFVLPSHWSKGPGLWGGARVSSMLRPGARAQKTEHVGQILGTREAKLAVLRPSS